MFFLSADKSATMAWKKEEREREWERTVYVSVLEVMLATNSSLTLAEDPDAAHPSPAWWQRVHCHVKSRVAFIDVRATPIFRQTFYPTGFSSAGVFRSSFVFRGVPTNAKGDKFYKTNRSLCGGICFRWKMWGFYCSWVFATTPSVNYVLRVWRFGNLIFVKNWYSVLTLVDYIYINQNHRQKVIFSATLKNKSESRAETSYDLEKNEVRSPRFDQLLIPMKHDV